MEKNPELNAFLDLNVQVNEFERLKNIVMELRDYANDDDINYFLNFAKKKYIVSFETFEKKRKYKPLIKFFQLFDVILNRFKIKSQPNREDINIFKKMMDCLKIRSPDLVNLNILKMEVASISKIFLQDNDWRSLRKMHDETEILPQISLRSELMLKGFLEKLDKVQIGLVWKSNTITIKFVKKVIESLNSMKKNNIQKFHECLIQGRFDKKDLEIKLDFLFDNDMKGTIKNIPEIKMETNSMIIGDEGGVYLLLNKAVPKSVFEAIILESGVSEDFLNEKRNKESGKCYGKVVLGKGSFGKVSFALSVFGDRKVDIGQLVCVKKSKPIKGINLSNITESTLDDFLVMKVRSPNLLVPKPLDMAILITDKIDGKHKKGYLFMEMIPLNTADQVFKIKKFQTWEYQKPYIVETMKASKDLLLTYKIFNSDLKPPNTLYDPHSRKLAIIDLGSSFKIQVPENGEEKENNIDNYDLTCEEFGISNPYCPPEILEILEKEDKNKPEESENQAKNQVQNVAENEAKNIAEKKLEKANLKKAISYLCGVTLAEITSLVPENNNERLEFKNWKILSQTDPEIREELGKVLNNLMKRNPSERLGIEEGIIAIEKIGSDENLKKYKLEHYIEKVRTFIKNDPSVVYLDRDIIEIWNTKGVIEQLVVNEDPRRNKNQITQKLTDAFDQFLFKRTAKDESFYKNISSEKSGMLILLGEAGSGKSLALKLRFLEEVKLWEYGKAPLPIYFNMANETDIETVILNLNANLGCNLKLDEDHDAINLFIDSYDEGPPHIIRNTKKDSDSIIEQYLEKLSRWKLKKLLISCRTDFVQNEVNDAFSAFEIKKHDSFEKKVKFITDLGFTKLSTIEDIAKNRFLEEYYQGLMTQLGGGNPHSKFNNKSLLKRIIMMGQLENLRTGMLLTMMLNYVIKKNENIRLSIYEIYGWAFQDQLEENWEKFIYEQDSQNKKFKIYVEKQELAIKFIYQDIKVLLYPNTVKNAENPVNEKIFLWEGIKRFGELIAYEMSSTNKNRLSFRKIQEIMREIGDLEISDGPDDADVQTEWDPLFQCVKLMGMKLERRTLPDLNTEFYVGFNHETFKNYFLLRKLKRILDGRLERKNKLVVDIDAKANEEEERFLRNILRHETLRNYELFRFIGDDVKLDAKFQKGLLEILWVEQEKMKNIITNQINSKNATEKSIIDQLENPRAAVTLSLLVAGGVSFSGKDLSYLNLTDANLRGGVFYSSVFNKTNLTRANLRNANINKAIFTEVNLKALGVPVYRNLKSPLDEINFISFSPNEGAIALGNKEGAVKFLDSKNWLELKKDVFPINFPIVKAHNELPVIHANFSADGNTFAIGYSNGSVEVFELKSGNCLYKMDFVEKIKNLPANQLAVSSNHKRIALKVNESVYQIDFTKQSNYRISTKLKDYDEFDDEFESVRKPQEIKPEVKKFVYGKICSIAISSNGENAASFLKHGEGYSQSYYFTVWKFDTPEKSIKGLEEYNKLKYPEISDITCLSFSPNGKTVVGGTLNYIIIIWDVQNIKNPYFLKGHSSSVNSVCFSLDSKWLASGGSDKSVKIWDSETRACLKNFIGHEDAILSLCFSPDGKTVVSSARDKSVKIWECTTLEIPVQAYEGHTEEVTQISMSAKGDKFATLTKHLVKVWDSYKGVCILILFETEHIIKRICLSDDGNIIALVLGNCKFNFSVGMKLYNTLKGVYRADITREPDTACLNKNGEKIFLAHSNELNFYQFTEKDKYTIGTINVNILDTIFTDEKFMAKILCVTEDEKKIASISGKNIDIWCVQKHEKPISLQGHEDEVVCIVFNKNGNKLVSGSKDKTIRTWDISQSTGDSLIQKCDKVLNDHTASVITVLFSTDETKVFSGSLDQTVKVWDYFKGICLQTINFSEYNFEHLSISNDWKILVLACKDKSIKIFHSKSNFDWEYMMNFGTEEPSFTCKDAEFSDCLLEKESERDNLIQDLVVKGGGHWKSK